MICLIVFSSLFSGPINAETALFTDSPFWQNSVGWWRSTNTYFDGNLDYQIREYHSLVHVTADGDELIEIEHKFYPPGKAANLYGGGKVHDGEGIEVVSTTRWTVLSASTIALKSSEPAFGPPARMETQILSEDTAVRRVFNPGDGSERYRMLITLHDSNRRNIANYGLAPDAETGLSGFALFRGVRISEQSLQQARASLIKHHSIAATLRASDDSGPVVKRMDEM
ncbi:MAG: hypothetical protein AB8B96_01390 [Lysobacterales bacterium]